MQDYYTPPPAPATFNSAFADCAENDYRSIGNRGRIGRRATTFSDFNLPLIRSVEATITPLGELVQNTSKLSEDQVNQLAARGIAVEATKDVPGHYRTVEPVFVDGCYRYK